MLLGTHEHGRARDVADGDAGLVRARDRRHQRAQPAQVHVGAQRLLQLLAQQPADDALADRELDAVVRAHPVDLHRAGSRTAAHRRASAISEGIPGSRHASFSATSRSSSMSRASNTTPSSVRAISSRTW